MIYSMRLKDLDNWVKTKAKPGEVAVCYTQHDERRYCYFYKGPDPNPFWRQWRDDIVEKYLEEINKLKVEEPVMNNRCENCKYFKNTDAYTWCTHKEHSGMLVPKFTSCPEHEPKEKKSTPFDGMKFYLKDKNTGELAINYICEDCGKEMPDAPYHWWLVVPATVNAMKHPAKRHGYHFRCEECEKKLGDKK